MAECALCRYAGSTENKSVAEAMAYISDSVGKVAPAEIARQVSSAMNEELGLELTEDDVLEHMQQHTLDQRVVLGNILKDLIAIKHDVKGASVVHDPDSGARAVDTKALLAYLKTVEQITSIYKMECMRTLYK